MAIKTYAQWPAGSSAVQYIASKDILTTAPAMKVLDLACEEKTLKRQMGASIVYRRWLTPAIDTTPTPEGGNKDPRTLVPEDYTGTMLRYAERIQVSRVDYDLSPFDAVMGSKDRIKQLVISDRERIRWNAVAAGVNVVYNSPAIVSRATVNGPISAGRIQLAVRSLMQLKGMTFAEQIGGANKIGTSPIEASFYLFGHTNQLPDFRALPGWVPKSSYPANVNVSPYEVGSFQNVRVFLTPEALTFPGGGAASTAMINTAGNTDVYINLLLGKEAAASVKLEGDGAEGFGNFNLEVLDKADKFDPSNAWVDIVATWYDLCMITANDWTWRLEVGATLNT